MSLLLALTASVCWGCSDFAAGRLTRHLSGLYVLLLSQAVGLVAMAVVALLSGMAVPVGTFLVYGVLAGLAGPVALYCFYRALALGPMGLASPLSSTGVVVPVVVGAAQGQQLTILQGCGIVLVVVGIVLASGPKSSTRPRWRTIVLALVSALGFGAMLVFIARGAQASVLATLLVQRTTYIAVVGPLLLALRTRLPRPDLTRTDWAQLCFIGLFAASAIGSYALASRDGLLSVSATLASLSPIVTALLAYWLLHERLRPVQAVGSATAFAGVVAIMLA